MLVYIYFDRFLITATSGGEYFFFWGEKSENIFYLIYAQNKGRKIKNRERKRRKRKRERKGEEKKKGEWSGLIRKWS